MFNFVFYVVALTIRFGLEVKEEPTNLAVLWRSKLLNDKV